jgi:hypothetical protein
MIDQNTYRLNEAIARKSLRAWRLEQIHSPVVFKHTGFPVQLDSLQELTCLLDTMHENHFVDHQRERGGLTESEKQEFVGFVRRYIDFFRASFHSNTVELPLSTMMAHFVLLKKILACNSKVETILEIGPGCGYSSFFLSQIPTLTNYAQIESTESFYILQSMVNGYLFGPRFKELAWQSSVDVHAEPFPQLKSHFEERTTITVPDDAICTHYPWWRIGDVPSEAFDIITSNANLNEFSPIALKQYVNLMQRCLKPEGAVIVQCIGGGSGNLAEIFNYFILNGFAVGVLVPNPAHVDLGGGRHFASSEAFLVRMGHPLYEVFLSEGLQLPQINLTLDLFQSMYCPPQEGRRFIEKQEIVDALRARA